jgi:hypothetical protein
VNDIKRTRQEFVELAYEVRTSKKSSLASAEKLIVYLSKYPLFSSKHQDFLSSCFAGEIDKIRLFKLHKTLDGIKR